MRHTCSKGLAALALLVLLGLAPPARGAEFDFSRYNQELGLRFGLGFSHSHHVRLYSLLPRWGIFLVRPNHTLGLSFVVEGIVSLADALNTGFELGITPMVKLSYRLSPGVVAFLEGGGGLITESFDSKAVAHSFNFTPQAGGGLDFALTSRLALTLAYRFRHASNAGIYRENRAFNCSFGHLGLSYYF